MARMNGLEIDAPREGIGRDCFEVASTVALLMARVHAHLAVKADADGQFTSARHACTLHKISGQLHRLNERSCNGYPNEKAEARLWEQAQEIAAHYGLRAYHQTDPRGCALYLCEPGQTDDYSRGYAVVRIGR